MCSAKTPTITTPPPAPAAPTAASTSVQNAANAAKLAAMSAGGQSSTILTGPMGLAMTNATQPRALIGS